MNADCFVPFFRLLAIAASAAFLSLLLLRNAAASSPAPVRVGVVVDLTSDEGRRSLTGISTAVEEFHRRHPGSAARLELRVRDSRGDAAAEAHAAEDLIKNDQVQAIVTARPQTPAEYHSFARLRHRHHRVPILTFPISGASPPPSRPQIAPPAITGILTAILSTSSATSPPHGVHRDNNIGARPRFDRRIGTVTRRRLARRSSPSSAGEVLRIAVPLKNGFQAFVDVKNRDTKAQNITGYCIDVFNAAMSRVPHRRQYEFHAFDGTYDELKFSAAVGDVTITAEREGLVDFTMPYTPSGVSLLVLQENDSKPIEWIFVKPLTRDLWLVTIGFFFYIGFVVWMIERPRNPEYQGTIDRQLTTATFFAFGTLTFSQGQIIRSPLSKIVVVIWCFVVLILVQSYTASLSSMLTAKRLRPSVTSLDQLLLNGDYVGYQNGSFVGSLLKKRGFLPSRLRPYGTPREYADALRNGSMNGGVSAIVDEIPYLTSFLSNPHYQKEFQMVNRFYRTPGFGFWLHVSSDASVKPCKLLCTTCAKEARVHVDDGGSTSSADGESNEVQIVIDKNSTRDQGVQEVGNDRFQGAQLTQESDGDERPHEQNDLHNDPVPEHRVQTGTNTAIGYRISLDSLVSLTCWFVWKERNNRVFNNLHQSAEHIFFSITEEIRVVFSLLIMFAAVAVATNKSVRVGVVLDLTSDVGRKSLASVSMALDDFYAAHDSDDDANANSTARVELIVRDSRGDVVTAADAGYRKICPTDLFSFFFFFELSVIQIWWLGKERSDEAMDLGFIPSRSKFHGHGKHQNQKLVQAIIGPHTSAEAEFIAYLGNHTHTPILSLAETSTPLVPFFLHTAPSDTIQVTPIAATLDVFNWRAAIVLYQNTPYGASILPDLVSATQGYNIRIMDRVALPIGATEDYLNNVLDNLKKMSTKVFIVHMLPDLAAHVLRQANVAGMMSDGYVWIATSSIGSVIDSLSSSMIDNMQGVVTFRPYVRETGHVMKFILRLKGRFWLENPSIYDVHNPSMPAIWAYDTMWALATAVNVVKVSRSTPGTTLLNALLNTTFDGLAGRFRLINGQLELSEYEIVNIIGKSSRTVGFWTPESGLFKNLKTDSEKGLKQIIWPGDLAIAPKGWDLSSNGQLLHIAVPFKHGFPQIVEVSYSPTTNNSVVKGYCIDVFDMLMKNLHYPVSYQYELIGNSFGNYDGILNLVHEKLQKVDAMVGDTTITASRLNKVSFTMPFTEIGLSMVVAVKKETNWSMWIFLRPLSPTLWIASLAFFFFTGFVVWVLEHRINPEFRGTPWQQFGVTFYFAFSTLVFSHKEKLESNLSRFVVIIWVFVVLVLTSSYTASLTSMLTVQQLQPAATNVQDLLRNGNYVGYQKGSPVVYWLEEMGFKKENLRGYASLEEYDGALQRGSENGGVSTVFDEIPYLKAFLSKYCQGYTMVGPTYKLGGFGFAFPIGSLIVHDLWQAFMLPSVQEEMARIDRKWFGDAQTCEGKSSVTDSSSLGFSNFSGLFLISAITSGLALLIHLAIVGYQEGEKLRAAVDGVARASSRRMHVLFRCLRPEPEVDVLHGGDTVSF
uniref:Ionotropic glutamate receptor C-terminal domain-containing protein n=1 Tax=Leersia perrieri TaxID=77586 RepID=A0A0D9WMS4_9ORYZ